MKSNVTQEHFLMIFFRTMSQGFQFHFIIIRYVERTTKIMRNKYLLS